MIPGEAPPARALPLELASPRPLRVLAVVDYYLPGFKAGGPVRSISGLVRCLSSEMTFDVATSDRDLGDERPYAGIQAGSWQPVEGARVRYLRPHERTLRGWLALLRQGEWDLLYLNSLFSASTIRILVLRRLHLLLPTPLLLAPRGELHAGALSLKWPRKAAWLALSRLCGLYNGVRWHAATDRERNDIGRILRGRRLNGSPADVLVAPNVATATPSGEPPDDVRAVGRLVRPALKRPGHLRVAFVSRICRQKNLDYALCVLSAVTGGTVEFDIFGPVEDRRYWRGCQALISRLPSNVTARYAGTLAPESVCGVLAAHDLLFLPTRGESFGHVVVEALSAGCPVLVSDQTPWRNLASRNAGWEVPLAEPARFAAIIDSVLLMDAAEHERWRAGARGAGEGLGREPEVLEASRRLFSAAAGQRTGVSAEPNVVLPVQERTG